MQNKFSFKNGETLKDKISGVQGVVMARGDYLTGCNRYGLMKQGLTEKGGLHEWIWLDESRLELVDVGVVVLAVDDPGGPSNASEMPPSN